MAKLHPLVKPRPTGWPLLLRHVLVDIVAHDAEASSDELVIVEVKEQMEETQVPPAPGRDEAHTRSEADAYAITATKADQLSRQATFLSRSNIEDTG